MSNFKVTIKNEDTGTTTKFFTDQEITKTVDTGRVFVSDPKPKSIYDLTEGDRYWFIGSDDYIEKLVITGQDHVDYRSHLEYGNAFLTKEEAEKELERRKAIARIKKWKWENGMTEEESGHNDKYRTTIIDDMGILVKFLSEIGQQHYSPIGYFEAGNDAQKCVKECNDDLRIVFGI